MTKPVSLKIELPNIPEVELIAISGLEHLARFMNISDEKIGEARILLTEAIINAFEHGGNTNSTVDVKFTITSKELIIFVHDYGKGFKTSSIEEPNIDEKLISENKRGWGLKLMKEMSDDLHIESNNKGTTITIKKLLG